MENAKKHVELDIVVPEGVNAEVSAHSIKVSGKHGSVSKAFTENFIHLTKKDNKIIISSKTVRLPYKKQLAIAGTVRAHVRNMLKGVSSGVTYKLKVVYSHFPMRASVKGNKFFIENFLGEKNPRTTKVYDGVKVDVKGNDIVLSGADKDSVSQTAANIEQATRIKNRDPRVFQDGIYITEKDSKPLMK